LKAFLIELGRDFCFVGAEFPLQVGGCDFALDRDVKKPHENPAIGVLLCASQDAEVVEYALSRTASPALIAEYQTQLPDKALLEAKLHEFYLQDQAAGSYSRRFRATRSTRTQGWSGWSKSLSIGMFFASNTSAKFSPATWTSIRVTMNPRCCCATTQTFTTTKEFRPTCSSWRRQHQQN